MKHFKEQLNKIAESNEERMQESVVRAQEDKDKIKFAHAQGQVKEVTTKPPPESRLIAKKKRDQHSVEVMALQKQPEASSTFRLQSTLGRDASNVVELMAIHQQLTMKR